MLAIKSSLGFQFIFIFLQNLFTLSAAAMFDYPFSEIYEEI